MSKITLEGECHNCKQPMKLEGDLPKTAQPAAKVTVSGGDVPISELEAIIERKLEPLRQSVQRKEEPPAPVKKKAKGVSPFVKKYTCKGCGKDHPNEDFTGRAKGKCDTCGQFALASSGACPHCAKGEMEPVDREYLKEIGFKSELEEDENENEDGGEGHGHE